MARLLPINKKRMQLIFATNNQHKVNEIRQAVGDQLQLLTLKEAGIDTDIPEPFDTLEENATNKSRTIYDMTGGANCFSEDTGLEVDALNGEPGVKSARYAGEGRSSQDNIIKLLGALENQPGRSARFRTVISVIIDGKESFFEGICTGRITHEQRGTDGFGYDPVFIPDGSDKTFAEMNMHEKNRFSHRKKAVEKLVVFLKGLS
jgi:XTP/dITP diphosphohydrolase